MNSSIEVLEKNNKRFIVWVTGAKNEVAILRVRSD
jgi:hypothetical protein